jgi:hypothetical protein
MPAPAPPPPRLSPAQSELGADVHALVVRTASDVLVVFRGMDSRRDVDFMDTVTAPDYDASYYGDGAKAAGAAGAARKLANGKPNPEAWWVLEGYTKSYDSMHGPITALLKEWAPKVRAGWLARRRQRRQLLRGQRRACGPRRCSRSCSTSEGRLAPILNPVPRPRPRPQLPEGHKVWFLGHSDGSQLAQLAALKHAADNGPDAVGGIVTFGSSRVGSVGFAKFFNSLLGDKMVYFSYGRDPAANTDYLMSEVRRQGQGWGGEIRPQGAPPSRTGCPSPGVLAARSPPAALTRPSPPLPPPSTPLPRASCSRAWASTSARCATLRWSRS